MTKSGVYEILNTTNGHRYIGSAVSLRKRKHDHWRELRRDTHCNEHLQRAWNKYGEDAFKFDVLEYWEPEFLVSFEQWWMNMLQPEYNIRPVAGSSLGVKRTAETRAKMSAAMMGKLMGYKHTETTRARISAALMGNQRALGRKHTKEMKAKISAAMKGIKKTGEHKANISVARVGMKFTNKHRAKISAAKKGKPWPPARRAAEDARQAKNNTRRER